MSKRASSLSAPFIVWTAIFTIVPLCMVLYFALTDAAGGFTLSNIVEIGNYSGTLWLSILLGLISTVCCLILGYPIAFIMSRMRGVAQRTMVLLIMLPEWMNFLLRTYAWMTILERNGLINGLLGKIGLGPFQMINTRGAVVIGMIYNFLPYMIVPIYSVMTKIDERVTEAAQDLGANGFNVFRRVIMPLSLPGVITGVTMVFVPAVSTFIISKLLGGGKEMLVGDVIELFFAGSATNYNVGSALSLALMLLMVISMAIMNRFDDSEEMGGMML